MIIGDSLDFASLLASHTKPDIESALLGCSAPEKKIEESHFLERNS